MIMPGTFNLNLPLSSPNQIAPALKEIQFVIEEFLICLICDYCWKPLISEIIMEQTIFY